MPTTSPEIASLAGRILAAGNPLDNEQVVAALGNELAKVGFHFPQTNVSLDDLLTNYQVALMAAVRKAVEPALKPYFDNMLSLAGSCVSQAKPESENLMISSFREINWERVGDVVTGALEGGGSAEWIASFHPARDDLSVSLKRAIDLHDGIWYYSGGSYWRDGGKALVTYDSGNTGGERSQIDFGREQIELGLHRMAAGSPRHFNDFVEENDDAITSDIFMQYAILGEIVYG